MSVSPFIKLIKRFKNSGPSFYVAIFIKVLKNYQYRLGVYSLNVSHHVLSELQAVL